MSTSSMLIRDFCVLLLQLFALFEAVELNVCFIFENIVKISTIVDKITWRYFCTLR